MSNLSLVRTLIADKLQYGVSSALGDNKTKEFLVANAPIYPGSAKVYLDGVISNIAYDEDDDLGLFTFVSAPTIGVEVQMSYKFTCLSDQDIEDLLDQYEGEDEIVKLAAADCLDIIASSEAMIQKRIKILDLETDGTVVAAALRAHADTLRKQAYDPGFVSPSFDLAEQINDRPGFREKLIKDVFRVDNSTPSSSSSSSEEASTDPVTANIADLVVLPQSGVELIGGVDTIWAMKVGKVVTLNLDIDLVIPAGLTHIEIVLPEGYVGKAGCSFSGTFFFIYFDAPDNGKIGAMYIQPHTGVDRIALYSNDFTTFPEKSDLYISGQMTYCI